MSKLLLELSGFFFRELVELWGEVVFNDSYDFCGDVDNMLVGFL